MGLLASLVLSVPTFFYIWVGVNKNLALVSPTDTYINSAYLWGAILIFSAIALIWPNTFISIIGSIWRQILKVQKWWGW